MTRRALAETRPDVILILPWNLRDEIARQLDYTREWGARLVVADPDHDAGRREPPMKVVLFCGGRGLRLREHSEAIPKPMVPIGYRPILWHVMRYYAHFGHRDFILCLGYRGDAIKDYFLHYNEAVSNDFVLSDGGRQIELLSSDIADWRITFADTGLDTTIGERLRRVRHHLEGEEIFLANYGDTLTDAPLDRLVEEFRAARRGGGLPRGPADELPVSRRAHATGDERVDALVRARRRGPLDQRRLLHVPPRDLRRTSSPARSSSRRRSRG